MDAAIWDSLTIHRLNSLYTLLACKFGKLTGDRDDSQN